MNRNFGSPARQGGAALRSLALLSALMAFGPISADLSLPAMSGALADDPGVLE